MDQPHVQLGFLNKRAMLRRLSIRNLVLIESLDLEFGPGLCVLTGETGAGKSILLDALGLTLGARSDAGLVRHGTKAASVTAEFDVEGNSPAHALAAEAGLELDDELVLRRVVSADGRGRGFVNDQPVSAALLRKIGESLVEIEGQTETGGLLNPACHIDMLDAFAGLQVQVDAVAADYRTWRAAEAALNKAETQLAEARRDEDYLRHMVDELSALSPQSGEDAALDDERRRLMRGQKSAEVLQAAKDEIFGDGSKTSVALRLQAAHRTLERIQESVEGALDDALAALDRAVIEAREAEEAVAEAERVLDVNPDRLDAVESRLFALRAAARKHKTDPDSLAALLSQFSTSLASIDAGGAEIEHLRVATDDAWRAFKDAAEKLSAARTKAAKKLDAAVAKELRPLKLGDAVFQTEIVSEEAGQAGPKGMNRVRFVLSTTPGGPLRPLLKVASGGERARLLLALRVCLARTGTAGTLIFDEVDRGIGGAVAAAVGHRLARLAGDVQVLVVTHSPQVAAQGGRHLRVLKRAEGDDMIAGVDALSGDDRQEEIARMLSGAKITDEARAAALSLIEARSP